MLTSNKQCCDYGMERSLLSLLGYISILTQKFQVNVLIRDVSKLDRCSGRNILYLITNYCLTHPTTPKTPHMRSCRSYHLYLDRKPSTQRSPSYEFYRDNTNDVVHNDGIL